MYDIFFDLNNMHQVVAEEETSFDFEVEGEQFSFNFELDLPEYMGSDDDYAVIVREKYTNGATCNKCNEIYPYAEGPNQKDGSFRCYSCRKYG